VRAFVRFLLPHSYGDDCFAAKAAGAWQLWVHVVVVACVLHGCLRGHGLCDTSRADWVGLSVPPPHSQTGLELKALTSLVALGIPGLHFPLMCTADYLGQRLSVSSHLPIGAATLAYGSADGGKTVHGIDNITDAAVKRCVSLLWLWLWCVAVVVLAPDDVMSRL